MKLTTNTNVSVDGVMQGLGGPEERGRFVPERPQRELRELNRYRTTLVRERSAEVSRLHKTLEGANIKLASVATDIMGKSGRQMLKALIEGSMDTSAMAQLARGELRAKIPQWSGLLGDVPERTSAFSSPNNWPTSTFSMRP